MFSELKNQARISSNQVERDNETNINLKQTEGWMEGGDCPCPSLPHLTVPALAPSQSL